MQAIQMVLRGLPFVLILTALAGCAPAVPDSARGVGFDNSLEAQRARDGALARSAAAGNQPQTVLPPPAPVSSGPLDSTGIGTYDTAAATAAETQRILVETRPELGAEVAVTAPAPAGQVPVPRQTPGTTPEAGGSVGLSDENDFAAVAERESIESDARRIEANRAQYQVAEPQELPTRDGDEGPNIVAYALQTSHPVGQQVHARSGFNGASRAARQCAQYPSPDQAQIDFLSRGGPERDGKGLDPDGDGYACSWDPRPFRRASQG